MQAAAGHGLMNSACRRFVAAAFALTLLGACQTGPAEDRASVPVLAPVYSGYFVWDSERRHGDAALQCMQLVLDAQERLDDGRVRMTGVTRYVTGPNADVNFVEAEVIFDPETGRFEMWERNATSNNFVSDGRFRGKVEPGRRLLTGTWLSDGNGESGRLTLRIGADAPCTMAQEA